MKFPKGFASWFVVLWLIPGGAGAAGTALDTVNKAVAALGGEAALRQVQTVVITANARHWEPQSSVVPGGDFKLAGISKIVITRDFQSGGQRLDWDRTKVGPRGSNFKFSEIYFDGVGAVEGRNGPQMRRSAGLGGWQTMSGIRLATFLREQHRASPLLVLDMKNNPGALASLRDRIVNGKTLRAVRYDAGRYAFTVMFDPATGLPERVRSRDTDPVDGDVDFDLVLSDWQAASGVQLARSLVYELGGKMVGKLEVVSAAVNAPVSAARFDIPFDVRAHRILPAMGQVPYQWVERRSWWGSLRDSDELIYDPGAVAGLSLVDIAPGVSHTRGGSHNSLVVEMKDYLIVFDAPIAEAQSRWTIDAAKAQYRKPVKYLILTHHHWDHANGARTYVAEGATVIVGQGSKAHFERMFSAPHTVIPDELARRPRKATVIEVTDKYVLSDGKRQVGAYHIEAAHSTGTLIGYVQDVRLGFVTDLWSPGRDPLPKKANQNLTDLVNGVKRHGLNPERFAGGHGTFAPYAPAAQLVAGVCPGCKPGSGY